jgi:hypothetical protein
LQPLQDRYTRSRSCRTATDTMPESSTTIRIPNEWKSLILQLRDQVTVDRGIVLLTAIANQQQPPPPEAPPPLSREELPPPPQTPVSMGGIPSALQGHVADLVRLHASHPEAAKTMLHATVIALKAARAAAKP